MKLSKNAGVVVEFIFKIANKYWFTGALKTQFLLSKQIFKLNHGNN